MKTKLYLLILILNFGCSDPSRNSNIKETSPIKKEIAPNLDLNNSRYQNLQELSKTEESDTYKMTIQKIGVQRNQFRSSHLQIDSIGTFFEISLLNKIIPFWEGTKWSFEGHTSEPKSGTIACGYFVSTTLQDVGMNINRYKLAQQSPINEARSLALGTEVKEISEGSNLENISAIKRYLKEGIHFIGFDASHVGYILKKNNDLYLIHSNYINSIGVEIERIEKSEIFQSYSKFYIVELSTNEKFLDLWRNKERIAVLEK